MKRVFWFLLVLISSVASGFAATPRLVLHSDMKAARFDALKAPPPEIVCGGGYYGHLQGVDTDGTNIWWSFTKSLVRTDLRGEVLARVEAPRHQGDLCQRKGILYVAVNLGTFNQPDKGVSEITAYDATSLAKLWTKKVDLPHGAGGMTERDGRFYVVGGLPAGVEENYVYEFDGAFDLVKRHALATGFTHMGIQTATVLDGRFYFGIYGSAGDPEGVLSCSNDLATFSRHTGGGSMGIIRLNGVVYTGRHHVSGVWEKNPATGRSRRLQGGKLVPEPDFCTPKTAYRPVWTGRGLVRTYFEAEGTNGWHDAGYVFGTNGYHPLFAPAQTVFLDVGVFCASDDVPAVGIGGGRNCPVPDLVRAVRRCAENDEAFALHLPGSREGLSGDAGLSAAVEAVRAECTRLGVRYE